LNIDDLNLTDLEQAIGLDFNIVVQENIVVQGNISKKESLIGSRKVTRVIKIDMTTGLSPAAGSTVSSQPFPLEWNRVRPGFDFKYMIEMYTYDIGSSQLVFREENISSDSVSYFVNQVLPA